MQDGRLWKARLLTKIPGNMYVLKTSVQVYERRREYQREEKSGRGRQRAEFATTETGAGFTCNNFNLSRIGFHYNG